MSEYENGRVRMLARSLAKQGVSDEIAAQILESGEKLGRRPTPEGQVAWMSEAMHRMDALLDAPTRHTVRERCACCLGGKRLQVSRGIAKDHATLEERIRAANEARFVFGHSVRLTEDGEVQVSFFPEGQPHYRCVCLPAAKEPISITYCYCCGGHVKHHLQIALGRKLEMTVRSSALASGGTEPCAFTFRMVGR